jgi:hypothetical protein
MTREELIDGLEGLSQMLSKENTGSDAGFDNICWQAAQDLRRHAQRAPMAADIAQIIKDGWHSGKGPDAVAAEILREMEK